MNIKNKKEYKIFNELLINSVCSFKIQFAPYNSLCSLYIRCFLIFKKLKKAFIKLIRKSKKTKDNNIINDYILQKNLKFNKSVMLLYFL